MLLEIHYIDEQYYNSVDFMNVCSAKEGSYGLSTGAMINNVNVRSASVCCYRLHNISYIYVQTFHLFPLIVCQINTKSCKNQL